MTAHGAARAALLCIAALAATGCAARGPVLEPLLVGGQPQRIELDATPFFPQEQYQCGPAALATVLAATAVDVQAESLASEVYLPGRQGSLQPELIAATRRHDRVPYALPPSIGALLSALEGGYPVLVLQKLGAGPFPGWHYAVVVGYDAARDQFVLRSGTARRKEMSARDFLATWDRAGRWALLTVQPGALPPAADFTRYMEAVAGLEAVGRRDAAALAYETAARQWPAESLPQLALANLAHARGDLVAAERGFHAAARLDPQDAAARNNRAEVLWQLGCITLARKEVEIARALAADGPLAAAIESTARDVAAQPDGDAVGCPTD
jgi:tetratricopeptide (TPR) repeat protein